MVANTYRIIIETSDLSKNNWNLIYRFIEKCYGRGSFGEEDFAKLREQAKIVIDTNPKNEDVYSCDGLNEIQFDSLAENQDNWMFNIIYKAGDREDFGDLVPFFLLKKKYRENITFGIDVENVIKQNDYTFKCSIFLFFIKDKKPKIGNHSIYFIHEFNTKTGEIINVSALKYTQKENDYSKASPNFIPLLPINEENFKLFQHANDVEIPLCKYISKSIKKSKLDKNINFSSKFEEWFIKAYCSNCNITTDFEQFKPSLLDYYINIYELVQNIIFHAQGRGLLYIIFNKKEDMLKDGKTLYPYCNIPNIDTYENTDRFLEIGIYDYNEKGIIDTFKENYQINDKDINLKTFADPTEVLPTDGDNLSIRYAAHLSIKSFVSSVLHHKGYFRVESNYSGNKTGIECGNGKIGEEYEVDNISGTHYEIVLPVNKNEDVKDYKPIFGHSVSDSLKELLKHPYNIKEIQFEESWMSGLKNISDKNSKTIAIQNIGNKIIDKFNYESTTDDLSIDMGKVDINTNMFFKILAYIQLNNGNNIKSLVFNNLGDHIIDDICEIIKNLDFVQKSKGQSIWSRDNALILMSKSFRTQIICGEKYPEICRGNQKINQFYYNKKNVFDKDESEQNETIDIDKFVLPYECVIENESGNLFLQYMEQILGTLLGTIEFGCLTDSKYTRIGSKLFLEHYYEADHVFKNSFFVDRLAYFIVKVIQNHLDNKVKNLILIGYLPYSELLVKKVKEYLESLSNKIVYTSIAKENEHTNSLDFKISDELKKKIKETDNQNLYITIVPIASSLSTNDKVISIFKQKNEITSDNFLNFCSIVVRDQDESKVSDNEKAFKWKEIKTEDNIIYTNYAHAKEIHYTVSKSGIWHPLIDKTTFPKQYGEEKYINQTQNSSLNTKDRFGYPIAALPSIDEIKDELKISVDKEIEDEELYKKYYELTIKRLKEMQKYIYVGHITHGNSHHRYYFNTEEYVGQVQIDEVNKTSEFKQWTDYLSKQNISEHPVNILISPDNDYESDFVNYINQKIFGNNAMIIYVSIDNPRQNIKTKFSFLKEIENPHFHFVDHALLTGETYHKTLSYIKSIMIDYREEIDDKFKFDNVFAIVNRLSFDIYHEIGTSLNGRIFSFVHFFVLPSKNPETDCSLCGLEKYYDNLKKHSVIASCRKIIENNKKKFEREEFSQYFNGEKKNKRFHIVSENSRIYDRMEFRHRLFFEIAICGKQDEITNRLKYIYDNECDCLDKRISFLKAITFPPLSQYVNIRSYAHQLTLNELGKTLEKVDPDINDLRFLKVLLKHLSWLNSNALVRKEVIEGSWKLYFRVYPKILEKQERKKAIDKEISELEKKLNSQKELAFELEYNLNNKKEEKEELDREDEKDLEKLRDNFQDDFQFYIKNATYDDEAKSLWLGELMKTGQEPNYENGSIEISKTELDNEFFRDPFLTFARELIYEIDIETQQVLAEKYYMFAEKTFNDNTTIFRKSLNNFKYELDKDKDLSKYYHYYVEDNGETKEGKELIKYKDFIRQKDAIISRFLELVNEQYYYTWFKYYLQKKNDSIEDRSFDEIHLIEKLSYLLYAKLYLNHIAPEVDPQDVNEKSFNANNRRQKDFQEKAKELLEILKEILDADGAFVTAKYQARTFYTIAKTEEMKYYNFDYESRNYLCKNIDGIEKKDQKSPIIIREDISGFEERNMLDCTVEKAVLWTSKATIGINTVTITFIFKGNKNADSDTFRIQKQELGRLLLLLTPQMHNYISRIRKEMIYGLWVKKTKQIEAEKNKFSRVNIEENHTFSPQGWMFYNFLEDDKNNGTETNAKEYLISYTRMLSNMIVKDLYSQLTYYGEIRKPSPTKSTISEIFNSNFLDLLDILLESNESYNIRYELPKPKDYDEILKNFNVTLHIPILQGCIIQCFENAVKKCRLNNYVDSRKIKFSIQYDSNNNSVIIKLMNSVSDKIDINNENNVFKEYYSDQAMSNLSKDEIIIKKYRFSLLSLIKYCESMGIKCKRWFDVEKKLYKDEYGFCIEIIIPGE